MSSGFQLAREQAAAYDRCTSVFMAGSARLLVEGARVRPTDVVVDLACGTGLVARHAASLDPPPARIVGVDVNAAMLEIACRDGDPSIEWCEASCEALPIEDGVVDVVLCQQGVQFFPDPVVAVAEVARVLRPGGRLIATVWDTPGGNPYIEHQLDLLATLDDSVAPSVRRATPAHADRFLRRIAVEGGLGVLSVDLLEHAVDVGDLPSWFVDQTSGTPWGPLLGNLTEVRRTRLVNAMVERLEPFTTTTGGHRIPFRSHRLESQRPRVSGDDGPG